MGNIPGLEVLTVEEYKTDIQRGSQTATVLHARTFFLRQTHFPAVLILFLLHELPHLLHLQSLSPSLEQGSASYSPQAKSCPLPVVFVNKVHWNTAMSFSYIVSLAAFTLQRQS